MDRADLNLGCRYAHPKVAGADALARALEHKGPALVEVITDPNALAMPPRATIKQAAGFALAMTKVAFGGQVNDVLDTVAANWRELV